MVSGAVGKRSRNRNHKYMISKNKNRTASATTKEQFYTIIMRFDNSCGLLLTPTHRLRERKKVKSL